MTQSQTHMPTDAAIAHAMQAALSAARMFEGATAPNPPVGCALLDARGDVIVTAAHQRAGEAHAEAAAIAQAKVLGRMADIHTVVVTLEPCNHHGRTPPCVEAILSTPAKQVVIGVRDPNPHVAGGGAATLEKAGLAVQDFAGDATQLKRLLAPFVKRVMKKQPFVTVKQALNRDGSMIPPEGQKTFTSQGSLLIAHALRRRADAIITGSGTVLADDPQFTVRLLPDHANKQRELYILDRRRRVGADYMTAAKARGFYPQYTDEFSDALKVAYDAGALEVLVEAGPLVTAHVLLTDLWDEHVRISQTEKEDKVEIFTRGDAYVLRNH
jgi:diaminohydroxyphosphoribosylaminopyrimidine deaminase / 5-amino-6-(5-phosphoribosylamino)uracil reductase